MGGRGEYMLIITFNLQATTKSVLPKLNITHDLIFQIYVQPDTDRQIDKWMNEWMHRQIDGEIGR